MFEFKHPKYYKELRKLRNKLDQAISDECATAPRERSPGPGPKRQASSCKQQAIDETVPHCDIEEATSVKPQATSSKPQASSNKLQASGEAASNKR